MRVTQFLLLILITGTVLTAGCQDQSDGNAPAPAPAPPPLQSAPSPTAAERGWRENELFGSVPPWTDYGQPGWVGDWGDVGTTLMGVDGTTPAPTCGVTTILEAGSTQRVTDCATAPPTYQQLCDTNYTSLRRLCAQLCAITQPPCPNPQVQPHVYEEWGCIGGPVPGTTIVATPAQYCKTIEGCVCTSTST